jgi:hypothetical protein
MPHIMFFGKDYDVTVDPFCITMRGLVLHFLLDVKVEF